jgi:hypothetical protein
VNAAVTRQRDLPDTNVLETTFTISTGRVRVTDALTPPGGGLDTIESVTVRSEDSLAQSFGVCVHLDVRERYFCSL